MGFYTVDKDTVYGNPIVYLISRPNALALLTLIRYRSSKSGVALVGDVEVLGITRQQYRTALNTLKKANWITTKTTNKGTVATLTESAPYIDFRQQANQQTNQQATTKNQKSNHQTDLEPTIEPTIEPDPEKTLYLVTCDEFDEYANQQGNQQESKSQPAKIETATTKGVTGGYPQTEPSTEKINQSINTRAKFSMNRDWQPDADELEDRARAQGVNIDFYSPELLAEFVSYWADVKPDETRTAEHWHRALIQNIARAQANPPKKAEGDFLSKHIDRSWREGL